MSVAAKDSLSSEIPPSVKTVAEPRSSPKTDSEDKPQPVDKGYRNDSLFPYMFQVCRCTYVKRRQTKRSLQLFSDVFLLFHFHQQCYVIMDFHYVFHILQVHVFFNLFILFVVVFNNVSVSVYIFHFIKHYLPFSLNLNASLSICLSACF